MNIEEVLDDILGSDPPETVDDVLSEAPILIVAGDENNSEEIIDRFFSFFVDLSSFSHGLPSDLRIILILSTNKVTLIVVMS